MKFRPLLSFLIPMSGLLHGQTIIDGGTEVIVPGTHNSPWNLYPNNLHIGDTGNGTLSISSSGKVYANTGILGNTTGSSGTVNVSGTGSLLNLVDEATIEGETGLVVGRLGSGTVNITDGGQVDSDGWITIGYGNSSGTGPSGTGTGAVNVSGLGSNLTGVSLRLARHVGSTGSLTISNRGSASIASTINVGGGTGGTNTWINVQSGGSLTTNLLYVYGGLTNGVRVTGENSTLTTTGQLSTGLNTNFFVEDGAVVNVGANIVVNAGDMSVTGTGSRLTTIGAATISTGSTSNNGRLNVRDGGYVSIGNQLVIGPQAGNNGAINVTGGGTMEVTGDTTAGNASTAVSNITVSGTGSSYASRGANFYLGSTQSGAGSSTLTVTNGGTVTAGATGGGTITMRNANSVINIGNGGNAGTIQATTIGGSAGRGTVNFNHTDSIEFGSNITGTFQLVVNKSGLGTTTLTGTNTYTGNTNITGGALINNGSLDATAISVANGAIYGGNGTHTGSIAVQGGGTITPGASVGILNTGSLNLMGQAIYQWELGDASGTAGTGWDLLSVTGSATISSTGPNPFTLELLKSDTFANFDPSQDYSFTIATVGGTINGFATDKYQIDASDIVESSTGNWSLAQSGKSLVLSYSAVPEPSAAALTALGLLAALRRRRSH